MSALIQDCPSLMFLFSFTVNASTEKAGIKKALPIIKQCEEFASGIKILCEADHFGLVDNTFTVRLIFNIKEPQDIILIKVSSLFSFAASVKLTLFNQHFFPE